MKRIDAKRAVEGLLERAEGDPELRPLVAQAREFVPVLAAIVAPREVHEVRAAGELPYDFLVQLLDRVSGHWQEARRAAEAQVPV